MEPLCCISCIVTSFNSTDTKKKCDMIGCEEITENLNSKYCYNCSNIYRQCYICGQEIGEGYEVLDNFDNFINLRYDRIKKLELDEDEIKRLEKIFDYMVYLFNHASADEVYEIMKSDEYKNFEKYFEEFKEENNNEHFINDNILSCPSFGFKSILILIGLVYISLHFCF